MVAANENHPILRALKKASQSGHSYLPTDKLFDLCCKRDADIEPFFQGTATTRRRWRNLPEL